MTELLRDDAPAPGLQSFAGRHSPWIVLAHDVAMAAAGMATFLVVRYHFEGKPLPLGMFWSAVGFFAAVCAVLFPLFRLHLGMWRFTAGNDVLRILRAVAIANLLLLPLLFFVNRAADYPRSAPVLATLMATAFVTAGRGLSQLLAHHDWRALFRLENRSTPPAVLVGGAAAVSAFLRNWRRRNGLPFRPAGAVCLDAPAGRLIGGIEVLGGMERLPHVLRALAAGEGRSPQVVLAEPRPTRELLDAVVRAAGEAGATVARARASGDEASLSPVGAADLLARPPRVLDRAGPKRLIEGRRVLVTGAGGTIGSELTRQITALKPSRLVLLDSSEFALYSIDQQLKERRAAVDWSVELGDIRHRARMEDLFDRERPDVVLHAAALKHVPLMETHPAEAVLTNVGGALNVAKLARERSEAFVFISTDKAVNPTNVMGATKRAAERAIQALAAGGKARAAIVRFGNVLGSNGSVVPLFERQIAEGGPITVTHPDMLRWFMTVQEASSLVLQAAALPAQGGQASVYVLDMGEPVKIDELARQLIRLHGLRPDSDVRIVYTGLRPGEKLSEEIFYAAEDVTPTAADGVLAAKAESASWDDLEPELEALLRAAAQRQEDEVLERLRRVEPAFIWEGSATSPRMLTRPPSQPLN
jgi:O-antigen biosynthesis protein WbqV